MHNIVHVCRTIIYWLALRFLGRQWESAPASCNLHRSDNANLLAATGFPVVNAALSNRTVRGAREAARTMRDTRPARVAPCLQDYRWPVEAVIPGAQGKVLGALSRTERELTIRQLADLAGVGHSWRTLLINQTGATGLSVDTSSEFHFGAVGDWERSKPDHPPLARLSDRVSNA